MDWEKLPVGTKCEVTYMAGPNHILLGAKVEIVRDGMIFGQTKLRGYSYQLHLLPGYEDRWGTREFCLYSYNLTPLVELTPEQLVSMRKELQHALERLREES